MRTKLSQGLWSVLLLVVVLSACAEERPPINRVQPYALPKSFFIGEDYKSPADNPEFWALATLIDVGGYGAAQDGLFTSTYAQNLVRIKWDITESMLLGRLAYERIQGADGRGVGKATNDGTVVAAFKIIKHFDVVRAYNPTTGEELNILEENSSDRPWYERDYIRVDWSKNLATNAFDFDTLSLLGVYGSIHYEPIAYDVTDPSDPNAPVFDIEDGYFDVTNKAFATPLMIDLSKFGWGIEQFPACYLPNEFMNGTWPYGSCDPVELTFRFSFRKVVDTDYEPADWDGYRFQAAGAFFNERLGYARNYGMTDEMWHRLINRNNIWERSHYYADPATMTGPVECFTPQTTPFGADPHRDLDNNGTEDECEQVGPGSRCDTFRQRCTLPYTQRQPKPLVWYVTDGSDLRYFEATRAAAHEWDVALRIAVRAAQYAECVTTGQQNCLERYPIFFGQMDDALDAVQLAAEVDNCREGRAPYQGQDCDALAETLGKARGVDPAVISIARMPEMIVLCHSPVQADDPAPCEGPRLPQGITAADCQWAFQNNDRSLIPVCKQARRIRLGDIRYHQVNLIREPQNPSPWGIWTGATDPITGEIVANCVNVWTWVNDYYSQLYVDIMRYIRGELKTEDVTEGTWVRAWSQAAEAAARGGLLPRLTSEDISRLVAEFSGLGADKADKLEAMTASVPREVLSAANKLLQQLKDVKAHTSATSVMKPLYAARKHYAAGTHFEAELMTPMVQEMMGIKGMPIDENVLQMTSLLRGGNPEWELELSRLKENALAHRQACILQPEFYLAPVSLVGLTQVMEDKFGKFNPSDSMAIQLERSERMRNYLARRFHYAVIAHEMGHGMGMRHNFVSSSFAWAYRPQYWQLRTKNGTVTTECTALSSTGEDCVGPRYFDPVTQEENDNLIWMWMHSSLMEYPGEITQDTLGAGAYDFHTIRMFYGDVATVARDPDFKVGTPKSKTFFGIMDTFGGIVGYRYEMDGNQFNYSQLHNKLRMISDCRPVDVSVFKPAGWDEQKDGVWSPLFDGLIVSVNGQPTRCRQQKVDYVFWNKLRQPTPQELGDVYFRGGPAVDFQGRVRMPYGLGSDEWADIGNLAVYRHDNGADAYEIFNWLITQQEINHIFDNYRRGRTAFSVRSAAYRTLTRYNEKIRDGAKGLVLMKNIYEDFAMDMGYNADTLWPVIANMFFRENIIASSQVFDHFARMVARPEPGEHYFPSYGDPVLRSVEDSWAEPGPTQVIIPNGATGYFGDIGLGGKYIENKLSENHGEYDRDYTINCGSYYDKIYTSMLMTESVDNFISDSRSDFVDARYRSVSLADLFPDGYRRWLGNNLTGDDFIKGPRVAANSSGIPLTDNEGYPAMPIGWINWWTREPQVCFPKNGTTVCSIYGSTNNGGLNPLVPPNTVVVDPQVGWEVQKFLIAWTMLYLPANQKFNWLDMLRVWELGVDANPELGNNRIEFHNPTGKVYVAKTFGKEVIFGKTVQRGIAARVLEYANELLYKAYVTDPGPDLDGDGRPDWYLPRYNPQTGQPIVKWDPTIAAIDENGYVHEEGVEGCNATDSSKCTCAANRYCIQLSRYVSVPAFLREAMDAYRMGEPEQRGIYD